MPNFATSSALVETATKCFAMAFSSPSARRRPVARRVRVGHGLERGESLGRNDEQRFGGVEVARRLGEVGAIDVRDEAEGQVALAVMRSASYAITGPRSEPPIPILIDVADRACRYGPVHAPLRTRFEKCAIRSSTACTCRHDVLAVDEDRRVARRAQRDVQHGALFGDVDFLAARTSRRSARAGPIARRARAAGGSSRR